MGKPVTARAEANGRSPSTDGATADRAQQSPEAMADRLSAVRQPGLAAAFRLALDGRDQVAVVLWDPANLWWRLIETDHAGRLRALIDIYAGPGPGEEVDRQRTPEEWAVRSFASYLSDQSTPSQVGDR
jgi:hypothetical protein